MRVIHEVGDNQGAKEERGYRLVVFRIERGERGQNEQASPAQPEEIHPPIEEETPPFVSRGSERFSAPRSTGRQDIEVCAHGPPILQRGWG